jgi:isoleucyl-tRNA synthetase
MLQATPDLYRECSQLVELAKLTEEPQDLHIPVVNNIVFKLVGADGKEHTYRRVPDVLDVWVDAGTASWNALGFPAKAGEDILKEWGAMEFVSEGKDQIRGWFNLLHVLSVIVTGRAAFKHVNMHGFINDAYGRKFSKSLGNYVLPEEVTSKYGVDALRYYMSGAAAPGLDMNYNFDDIEVKVGNLKVFWNLAKLCFDSANASDVDPVRN